MSPTPPHLKTLEEIERTCVPGLVEVLRTEGIEGVRYTLWDMTGWHRDYDPYIQLNFSLLAHALCSQFKPLT